MHASESICGGQTLPLVVAWAGRQAEETPQTHSHNRFPPALTAAVVAAAVQPISDDVQPRRQGKGQGNVR